MTPSWLNSRLENTSHLPKGKKLVRFQIILKTHSFYEYIDRDNLIRVSLRLELFADGVADDLVPVYFGSGNWQLAPESLENRVGHVDVVLRYGALVLGLLVLHHLHQVQRQLIIRLQWRQIRRSHSVGPFSRSSNVICTSRQFFSRGFDFMVPFFNTNFHPC